MLQVIVKCNVIISGDNIVFGFYEEKNQEHMLIGNARKQEANLEKQMCKIW